MGKLLNIRIEKQEKKIKVVNIQKYQVDILRKKFESYLKNSNGIIIITVKDNCRTAYSTLVEADTIYTLEKIKSKFLED